MRERAHYCNVGNEGDYAGHFIRTREQCILAGSADAQAREESIEIARYLILRRSMKCRDNKGSIHE